MTKLAGDPRVVNATRVARVLRLNPLAVLDTDTRELMILWAAVRICQADDKAAEDNADRNRKGRRG